MNFLLVTLGSHGDVHPFVGMGTELLRRGHRATLITNSYFEPLARRAGLEFISLGQGEDYLRLAENPDLWSVRNGWRVVFGAVNESLKKVYETISAAVTPDTVLIASSLSWAARLVQEKRQVPLATVHLSPSIFRSSISPPRLPGLFMPGWMPIWMRRSLWALGDRFMIDPLVCPPLNAFRSELGLPAVSRVLDGWWNSPQLVIGLFPDWFGPRQPDWPAQTRLTGFPLFDERGHEPLATMLARFLESGPAPIAFTPGSAMLHGHEFFQAAVDACRRLRRRGILLSRHAEQIPRDLPDGMIHVPYAPFSELLPRCCGLVHHGGIGTTAQGLRAGTPQLIMPMTHDQPDNALRVERLACGRALSPKKFTGRRVADLLEQLLDENGPTPARCQDISRRFKETNPLAETCRLLEQLGTEAERGLLVEPDRHAPTRQYHPDQHLESAAGHR